MFKQYLLGVTTSTPSEKSRSTLAKRSCIIGKNLSLHLSILVNVVTFAGKKYSYVNIVDSCYIIIDNMNSNYATRLWCQSRKIKKMQLWLLCSKRNWKNQICRHTISPLGINHLIQVVRTLFRGKGVRENRAVIYLIAWKMAYRGGGGV